MRHFQPQDFVINSLSEPKYSSPAANHKQPHKFKNQHKAITIGILFGIFFTYRLLYTQPDTKNCLIDNLHEWTFPINRWISKNFSQPFIGFGQIMMDINITSVLIYWYFLDESRMLYVKNFRVILVAAFFQYSRQLMLRLTTMPFESYTVWYSPGFPTWTVEYGHTSDYFFSGHTGTLVLLYMEARKLSLPRSVQIYFIFTLVVMIFMLLVARVHYTIDIVGGFLFSAFFYEFTDRYLEFFDMIVNSPYKVIMIVKENVKKKLRENVDEGTSLYDIQHA